MSKRKTDKFDDVHFSSDRFFYADNQWHYYVRTYDGGLHTVGGFDTRGQAESNCNDRFTNKIDHYFYHSEKK